MQDLCGQFVQIRRHLDELDLLNEWTTSIGSSKFAIGAGLTETEAIEQALFS